VIDCYSVAAGVERTALDNRRGKMVAAPLGFDSSFKRW
jgi:hypothetical protein